MQKSAFLIAGPKSNSGKTIITLGIIKALVSRGLSVQPFKCGPDYIDPMHHESVAGFKSYNLDVFMGDEHHIKDIFNSHSLESDLSIVEGVMGLFDGAQKAKGSSAAIAKLLNLPVILVVDAASTAYSIAPLLYGFKHFDKAVNIAGVIFNKVGSASHYSFLKDAADDVGVCSLGYIPKSEGLNMPSRHLGLMMPQEVDTKSPIDVAAELIEKHIDLEAIIEQFKVEIPQGKSVIKPPHTSRIFAVAQDEAFNFIYPANIDALKQLGEVKFFSPLHDKELPEVDLVWLPGGYPELFAKALSDNTEMRKQINIFAENGGAIIAECGGMMYMGKSLINNEKEDLPMCGVFDYSSSAQNMKLTLGYRKVNFEGLQLLGHEFHYSKLEKDDQALQANYKALSARDTEVGMKVYRYQSVWSSYMHLYLGELEKMEAFIERLM
ncbi:MAG: cobyrinate a,c-diamide synthase, partial [Bacteroidales bacterium]|nr:cobyrinate a,c-diamide synthase [Bacteroidales bacterium]